MEFTIRQWYYMIQICFYHIHFQKKFKRLIFHCFSMKTHKKIYAKLQFTNHHKWMQFFFISILENIVTKFPTNYPSIIIGDFNINMLSNTIESITLQNYMNTHNFHITFIQSITSNNTQIDHRWTNTPNTIMSYWINTSLLDRS